MPPSDWLFSPNLNLHDALITIDTRGLVIAVNEEALRLGLDGDPHGQPLEATFPIRDEFSGRVPNGLTRSVVLPMRTGEYRAFDLIVVPIGLSRIVILRPAIGSGDREHEAWANLAQESKEGTGLGDPATGTIGLVSETFAALHGYSPEEMLGLPLERLFVDDGAGVARMEEQLKRGMVSWESHHVRKDGTVFPVLMSVTTIRDPLGLIRFRAMRVQDISLRRWAEDREVAGRHLLERVIAAVPSVVYLLHPEKGEIRFLSREAVAHGYASEGRPDPDIDAIVPSPNSEALHPDDENPMRAHRARLPHLADGEIATLEYRTRDGAGGWRWSLTRDTVFERESDGRVRTILGTATDITETKAAEAR